MRCGTRASPSSTMISMSKYFTGSNAHYAAGSPERTSMTNGRHGNVGWETSACRNSQQVTLRGGRAHRTVPATEAR